MPVERKLNVWIACQQIAGWFGEIAHVDTGVRSEAKRQTYNRPFSLHFTPQNWMMKMAVLGVTH